MGLLEEARQLREEAKRALEEVKAQQIRADLRDELRNVQHYGPVDCMDHGCAVTCSLQ